MLIETIYGKLEETTLVKITGFEDRPGEFVTWVEWRKPHATPLIPLPNGATADEQLTWCRASLGELVKRECHVQLKQPSVAADAVAANLG